MPTQQSTPARQRILDYYTASSPMTDPGSHAKSLRQLPPRLDDLMRIVQGVCVHEYAAEPFYAFTIPESRKSESHIRPLQKRIDRLLELDARPIAVARPVEKRLVGVCNQFVLLLTAMLRSRGAPARARRGFGAYFNPGYFEDHVVCEYWDETTGRWKLADPQFDDVWRERLNIRHDVMDVPRDRFLTAADAWTACRARKADPAKFGIFRGDLRGLWFIAGALVSEVAGLNKMELLPWDAWGAMPEPGQ